MIPISGDLDMDIARSRHEPEGGGSYCEAVHYGRGVALADAVAVGIVQRKENCNDKEKNFY